MDLLIRRFVASLRWPDLPLRWRGGMLGGMKASLVVKLLFFLCLFCAVVLMAVGRALAEGEGDPRLAALLERFPEADADRDGTLTVAEATEFLRSRRGGGRGQNTTLFVPEDGDFEAAIAGGEVLAFPESDDGSLRLAMTGHSWVGPGIRTLPPLAAAAGYAGHRQVTNTGGGGTGSANAIWLKEFGKWREGVAAAPKLIPAISSGQWDAMSWGPYYQDRPEFYFQWIDWCLKHNAETVFFLQDAWPRFAGHYRGKEHAEVAAAIAAENATMQKTMFGALHAAFEEKYPGKVRVIPVAVALVDLIGKFAEGEVAHLSCIDEAGRSGEVGFYRDGGHLSKASGIEHLVGYGYFALLYRRSPATVEGYRPKGVPEEFDRQMREAIWKAVVSSPFAGIDDADGDGYADAASPQ